MTLEVFDMIRMTLGIVCIILGLALTFLCVSTAIVTIAEWKYRKRVLIANEERERKACAEMGGNVK